MIPVLGLVLAFCGFAVCVAVSVFIVWRYINRREKDIVSIIITTVSLSLVLFCVILIPFDVYSLNTGIQPNTTLSSSDVDTESSTVTFLPGVIKYLYYIFFSLLIFCVFGAIPFGYFYFEEGEDEDETVKERILSALKYSVCSILVAIVLIIIGAFVHTGSSGFTNSSDSDFYDTVIAWYDYVKGSGSSYTHGIGFVLSIIGLVGLAIWLVYTACGVFGLPVSLIRGKKHIADELNETQRALEKTRQKIRDLKDKHAGNIRFSLKYEQKLNVLKEKEKTYERHADLLMNKKESRFTRLMSYFKPLAIVLGAVLIIVAVFLLISIVMGLIGKALNSTCGHSCGFAFSIPKVSNPLDILLVIFAEVKKIFFIKINILLKFIFLVLPD